MVPSAEIMYFIKMMGKEKIGHYFKKLRKQKGLSQLEVSKILGYNSAQFVSNWERGLAAPPEQKIPTLLKLYSATVDEYLNLVFAIKKNELKKLCK